MSTETHYQKYKNLYRDSVDASTVVGATPHPDWMICEVIAPPTETFSAGGLILTEKQTGKKEPLVFRVLAVGSNVKNVSVDNFVCLQFLAGDKFANSNIICCHFDDCMYVWGPGLLKDN